MEDSIVTVAFYAGNIKLNFTHTMGLTLIPHADGTLITFGYIVFFGICDGAAPDSVAPLL